MSARTGRTGHVAQAPLIATKVHIPPLRQGLVARPQLLQRLDSALQARLILASAPAGFGKTTLLAEWAQRCRGDETLPLRVAWLSLDAGDDDPARFWTYVVAALRAIPPIDASGLGQAMLGTLQSPAQTRLGRLSLQALLSDLINEMATLAYPILLVLDDYHEIAEPAIHQGVSFLLEHLPPQMHLAIATRADPPLPLARLRGRGQLAELRQADLCFSPEEATAFLNRATGLDLSAENTAALASRTEGWIAGLQMAAISLQGHDDASDFVHDFAGSDRHIMDYLVEEVLECQPEAVQAFLLRTSILDRLSGPLCDAVASFPLSEGGAPEGPPGGSQALLELLESRNLFIIPLDSDRRWYRYHRLFADLLRKRLLQEHAPLVPSLHRLASAWYERNGDLAPAIEHALSAGDAGRAAILVEKAAEGAMMRGETATLLDWLEALPDGVVRSRPLLSVFCAGALLMSGRNLAATEERLRDAEAADSAGEVAGEIAAFRALIAAFRGQVAQCIELSHRALEQLPTGRLFLCMAVADNLGVAYMMSNDTPAALRVLGEAARMSLEAGDRVGAVGPLANIGGLHMSSGQMRRAEAVYREALALATDGRGRRLPIAAKVLLGLGELAREWDDQEAAERYLGEGIALVRSLVPYGAIVGYIALMRLRQAQGDARGAQEAIAEAERLAAAFDATDVDDCLVAAHRAQLAIAQGDLGSAERWARERGLIDDTGPVHRQDDLADSLLDYQRRKTEDVALARLLMAQARPREALTVLGRMLPAAEQLERMWSVIELEALRSLAYHSQGEEVRAVASLKRALSLAEPEGHVRVFLDEGQPMAALLREARRWLPECPSLLAYIERLLSRFPRDDTRDQPLPAPSPRTVPCVPPIEPLSRREVEVLALIAEGLSNGEIGQRLFISLSTVKVHTRNIYGKLTATNRTQAVARARALGLL